MSSPVDFLLVTPLDEERDSLLDFLPGYQREDPTEEDIRVYYTAQVPYTYPSGTGGHYSVVVMPLARMGHNEAGTATSDAVRKWKPRNVILVGIAGGVETGGARLGDILIADQVASYEHAKVREGKSHVRWRVDRVDDRLFGHAKNFLMRDWKPVSSLRPQKGEIRVLFGPVCTGNKVIADESLVSEYQEVWSKLIGVEMEAGGVANAIATAPSRPTFFMIRAVSDLANADKGTESVEAWRQYACRSAAFYTVEFLKSGPIPKTP